MTTNDPYSYILWLGGSACAGKSTVAKVLAARYDLTVYDCDAAYERHLHLVTSTAQPIFHRLAHLSPDDLWMRPVDQQIREEIDLYREEFNLILADLAELPTDRPILAEGNALLPELLAGIGISCFRSIWMVPTPEFQRELYARRPWVQDILADCIDPEAAWHNWMARDSGFAAEVTKQANTHGYICLTVDGSQSFEAIEIAVETNLNLPAAQRSG